MTVRVTFSELVGLVKQIGGVRPHAARPLAAALAIEAGVLPREERLPPWLRSELRGEQLDAALKKRRREERRAWKGAVPSLRRLLSFLPPEEACGYQASHPPRRMRRGLGSMDPWTLSRYVRALLRYQEVLERQQHGDSVSVAVANLPRNKLSLAQRMRLQWIWLLRAYGHPLRSSEHQVGALAITRALLRAFGLVRNPRGASPGRGHSAAAGDDPADEEEAERKQYRRAMTLLRSTTSPVREGGSGGNFVTIEMVPWLDAKSEFAAPAANARHDVQPRSFTFVPATPPVVALGKAISHLSSYVTEWEAIAQDPQLAQLIIDLPRLP
jgi:hypothetical protein